MWSITPNSGAAASTELNSSGRSLSRIRRWFLQNRSNYQMFERRLAKLESAWRQQMSVQSHAIEIAASVEQRVARTEHDASSLARMRPRLAKLESAWRQQLFLHLHATAIEDRLAAFEKGWRQ